jgi:hypothetical protein
MACRLTRLDAATVKMLTIGEACMCMSMFNGATAEEAYDDLSDCIGVKSL